MRQVENIRERRVPHVEFAPVMAELEHIVDQRFKDRVCLVEQYDLQNAGVRRGYPDDPGKAPQAP